MAIDTMTALPHHTHRMRADQARTIPISVFLDRAGFKPARITREGREIWYSSPLRAGDRTPSFKVDTAKNLWFDHGLARGGNVIDLVIEMRRVTVKEALAILESGFGGSVPAAVPLTAATKLAGEKENDSRSFEVINVRDIEHPALVQYLNSRCIDIALARQYLKELRFRPKGSLKQYFALGFPSGGGYDARSTVFKGFVGIEKDLSALNFADKGTVAVFEGVFDYLSWLSYRNLVLPEAGNSHEPDCSVIVLNSIAFRRRALDRIAEHGFGRIALYLDRDAAGLETLSFFRENLGNRTVVDHSGLYNTFKDLNEWWVSECRRNKF